MTRLLGISGSLRKGSFNTALLRAAQQGVAPEIQLDVLTLHDIPLYDGDVEAIGVPPAVAALKDKVAACDGVLLSTPEYNNGIPGVMKNAIDWMSRPQKDSPRVFRGRPFALIGATPGGWGTVLAQAAWLPVLRTLGADLWPGPRLAVSLAGKLVNEKGEFTDAATLKQLQEFVRGFAAFAAEVGRHK